MRRLSRLLAALVLLVGLLPCGMREALPVVGELVAACCVDDGGEAGDDDGRAADCCGTAACACAAPAIADASLPLPWPPTGSPVAGAPPGVDRPTWRAGPPPTPPPIA